LTKRVIDEGVKTDRQRKKKKRKRLHIPAARSPPLFQAVLSGSGLSSTARVEKKPASCRRARYFQSSVDCDTTTKLFEAEHNGTESTFKTF
jgi:hypothetical protein